MRGHVTDALGGTISQASPNAGPVNRFIYADLLNNPLLGHRQGVNKKERLIAQRTIPMVVVSRPQPVLTKVKNENVEVFGTGIGIVQLPTNALWGKIKENL